MRHAAEAARAGTHRSFLFVSCFPDLAKIPAQGAASAQTRVASRAVEDVHASTGMPTA